MPSRFAFALRLAWRAALTLVVLFSALLLLWMARAVPWPQRTIPLSKIRATEGFGFTAKLPKPWPGFAFAGASGVLTEDGRELTPVKENRLVRENGMGAFRVGGERVLFSSSDGSDPLKNGHRYHITLETIVVPSIRPLILLIGGFAALLLNGKKLLVFRAWIRRSGSAQVGNAPAISAQTWAIVLFTFALAVRIHFLWANPFYSDGNFVIRGTPFSDARDWLEMAKSTAGGRGVDSTYPGMRALYPMFLANFFTWCGHSLDLAKMLQTLIGAASSALIFLVLRRAMPLWAAIAASLFFALDPRQVSHAAKLMTEPFGLSLILLSAWCMMIGGERRRPGMLFFAGVFFACANLARPLTLFAFPIFVVIVAGNAWLREQRRWRSALLPSTAFALGAVICLAPWIIRERVVHGIWAISCNSSSALFAASTPEFGVWGNGVESLPTEAGVPYTVKNRYDYFQARFQENLKKYPGYYASNVGRSFGVALKGCANVSPIFVGTATGALAALCLMAFRFGGMSTIPVIALPMISATALLALANHEYGAAFAILGAAFTLWWRPFPAAVLIVCHGGGLLGSALFGNPDLQRVRLLIDWVEAGWTFAGALLLGSVVVAMVIRVPVGTLLGVPAGQSRDREDDRTAPWLRWIGWGFAAFLFVSTSRLVFLNAIKPVPPPAPLRLSDAERSALLQEFISRFPAWQQMGDPALMASTRIWRRRAFVEFGAIEKEAYEFPENVGSPHWSNRFEPRSYEHTSFIFRGSGESFTGDIWTEFAGKIPAGHRSTICMVIGLTKRRPAVETYLTRSVEAVAIIPAPNFKLDFARALVAPVFPETQALLEAPAVPQ